MNDERRGARPPVRRVDEYARSAGDDERRRADEFSTVADDGRDETLLRFGGKQTPGRADFHRRRPSRPNRREKDLDVGDLNATEDDTTSPSGGTRAPARAQTIAMGKGGNASAAAPSRSARVSTPTASTPRFAARCVRRARRSSLRRTRRPVSRTDLARAIVQSVFERDVDVLALSRAR